MSEELPKGLERTVEVGTLCAFYGGLLTERQQEALRLHYQEDYSLGEIAAQLNVSRQNVHEMITRGEARLRQVEKLVGGVARAKQTIRDLNAASELLRETAVEDTRISEALHLIQNVIRRQEGEDNDHGV